jgi:RNA polymerase sigma-70 factor (ECF subfamily)
MLMNKKNRVDRSSFLRMLAKSEPVIRAYLRSLVQDYHDHSEIMQNVFITTWDKFSTFEGDQEDFCKWACVIARFEALKHRQTKARDRLVLSEELISKIADEGIQEHQKTSQWVVKLEHCLTELPAPNRDLIKRAYSPNQSIKELAKEKETTPDALYQKLRRIRKALAKCMDVPPSPSYSI